MFLLSGLQTPGRAISGRLEKNNVSNILRNSPLCSRFAFSKGYTVL